MRSILALLICAFALTPSTLAEESGSARKVRVALAIASGCGKCRGDLEECRAESLAKGKPIVIFVGGCDGRAGELFPDVIPCRVDTYSGDDRAAGDRRIVIVGPKADDAGKLYIWATLPATSSVGTLAKSIAEAVKEAPKPVQVKTNWDFGNDAPEPEPEPMPVPQAQAAPLSAEPRFAAPTCANGQCPQPSTYRRGFFR
jgi:hypothetical protein